MADEGHVRRFLEHLIFMRIKQEKQPQQPQQPQQQERSLQPMSELMNSPLRSSRDLESASPFWEGSNASGGAAGKSPLYFTPRHSPFRHPVRTPPPGTINAVPNGYDPLHPQGHFHYSHRAPWLRALVLGANDGLVTTASIMVGMTGARNEAAVVLAGVASLIAGACSMAIGEYVSVSTQRDTELGDIEKERQEHEKGPEAVANELEELTQIYVKRGLSYPLAKQVAEELSREDPVKAHARDELGIDVDDLANPAQAAIASALAFASGSVIPLLAGTFVKTMKMRLITLGAAAAIGLGTFGAIGAIIGGSQMPKAIARVVIGGFAALLLSFGIMHFFGKEFS